MSQNTRTNMAPSQRRPPVSVRPIEHQLCGSRCQLCISHFQGIIDPAIFLCFVRSLFSPPMSSLLKTDRPTQMCHSTLPQSALRRAPFSAHHPFGRDVIFSPAPRCCLHKWVGGVPRVPPSPHGSYAPPLLMELSHPRGRPSPYCWP